MKKLKKLTAVLLTAMMILVCLSGCGSKKNNENAQVPILEGDFVPQKDLELMVWQTQGTDYVAPEQPDENLVEKWLIDKTKVKIVNAYGNGGGSWDAMLARLIVGENFPDLVACGGGQGPTHFKKLNEAGKIYELTWEMLEKYCPDVIRETPPEFWEKIKVDGKIFGIPYGRANYIPDPETMSEKEKRFETNTPYRLSSLMIRDDILKTLRPEAMSYKEAETLMRETNSTVGDEIADAFTIKSTEEFVEFLREIKKLNLKVGDKPVFPMAYTQMADAWVPMCETAILMTGHKGHFYPTNWNNKTRKIEMTLYTDWIKENMLLQNQMIREGLIDPESLMQTDSQYKEKALSGQYAFIFGGYLMSPTLLDKALRDAGSPYSFVPVFFDITPQEGYEQTKAPTTWQNTISILNTVPAEDVPQILNWINTQFTEEYSDVYWWGPKEAGLYTEEADGKRKFKDEKFNQLMIYNDKRVSVSIDEKKGLGITPGMFAISALKDYRPDYYNDVISYEPAGSGFSFDPDGKYAVRPADAPSGNIWDPIYAEIPEVDTFWNQRTSWEDPFKLTLTAKSDKEFLEKWDKAVAHSKSITDTDKMLAEMTRVANESIK